jgi:uncharacterized membrane protein YhaH (DUF805 family)
MVVLADSLCCLDILIFLVIVFAILLIIFTFGLNKQQALFTAGMSVIAILYIVYLFSFVFTIRRLHDRNNTGWLSLLMLVPVVKLAFLFIYLCKGTEGLMIMDLSVQRKLGTCFRLDLYCPYSTCFNFWCYCRNHVSNL